MDKLLPFNPDEFGVTEHDGRPVVSSRYVAQVFGKRHEKVIRDIEELCKKLPPKIGSISADSKNGGSEFGQLNFEQSSFKDNYGRKQPEYLMTRDGFTLLAMGFTGVKALRFKVAYINRFNQMEEILANLAEMRLDHPEFTAAIQTAHADPQPYHYSNEFDLINHIVLGMRTREFKQLHGIPKDIDSIRPYLTPEQVQLVKKLVGFDMGLLLTQPDFQERKRALTDYHARLMQPRALPAPEEDI